MLFLRWICSLCSLNVLIVFSWDRTSSVLAENIRI